MRNLSNPSEPESFRSIRTGCRDSKLSLTQSRNAVRQLCSLIPDITWSLVSVSSPGDRDQNLDLRRSPGDFFTRDLDEKLRAGDIDCALHSAKDLPPDGAEGIDWFWLPWREEPGDALVLRKGFSLDDLKRGGRIGISSRRREEYCRRFFPAAEQATIRGNIEKRIAQVDEGAFDAVVIAAAALIRLDLEDRISCRIPLNELMPSAGQGYLALTFKTGNRFFQRLRALLHPPVRLIGAGVGSSDWITRKGAAELSRAGACLYDALLDERLLQLLPAGCERIPVGKRMGSHSMEQEEISRLLCDYARRGVLTVRLKGGDPGIFGRLPEETDALAGLGIPFRVYPGVSALNCATTGTGLLLTRRGRSRGFKAVTPVRDGETRLPSDGDLPSACFMSLSELSLIAGEFLHRGYAPSARCAVIYEAGSPEQEILVLQLKELSAVSDHRGRSGLVLVGLPENEPYPELGPLEGARVLLTCSDELMERALLGVEDAGGRGIPMPLVGQRLIPDALPSVEKLESYDWLVLTSPAAIRLFISACIERGGDLRRLPKLMVCGSSSAEVLARYGLKADFFPGRAASAEALLAGASGVLRNGERVLRLRSDLAGSGLAEGLREHGADVEDLLFYRTEEITYEQELPEFDAAFFASASAACSFVARWGAVRLQGKSVLALGSPTARALEKNGAACMTARNTDAYGAFETLKIAYFLRRS